jgi:hypothetical protein
MPQTNKNLGSSKGSTTLLSHYTNYSFQNKNIHITPLFLTTSSSLSLPLTNLQVPICWPSSKLKCFKRYNHYVRRSTWMSKKIYSHPTFKCDITTNKSMKQIHRCVACTCRKQIPQDHMVSHPNHHKPHA